MDQKEAYDVVKSYLVEQFDVPEDRVSLEAHLFEELELDSIDALDMVGLLEARLGVQVDEDELKKIRRVADVVDYVVHHAP